MANPISRSDYERYVERFNRRDYDAVFDFFHEKPEITFFGIEIRSRTQLHNFYSFLHTYVRETVHVEKFASSHELVAVEGIVKIEGIRDLTRETLAAQGMEQFFPIKKGDTQSLRQYIHYGVKDGKFISVGCALVDNFTVNEETS